MTSLWPRSYLSDPEPGRKIAVSRGAHTPAPGPHQSSLQLRRPVAAGQSCLPGKSAASGQAVATRLCAVTWRAEPAPPPGTPLRIGLPLRMIVGHFRGDSPVSLTSGVPSSPAARCAPVAAPGHAPDGMNVAVADDRAAIRGPIVSNGPGRASGRAPRAAGGRPEPVAEGCGVSPGMLYSGGVPHGGTGEPRTRRRP
jgi:hypothetical protein